MPLAMIPSQHPAVSSTEANLPTRLLLWCLVLFVLVGRMMPLTRRHANVRVRQHQTTLWIYSTSQTHRSCRNLVSVARPLPPGQQTSLRPRTNPFWIQVSTHPASCVVH